MRSDKGLLITAALDAIGAVDLGARVRDALSRRPKTLKKPVLIAIGKSASPMLAGALGAYGRRRFSRVIAARPWGSTSLPKKVDCEEFVCGHPLPDEKSVEAAQAILESVRGLSADDTVIVLLSGGASAAVCLPRAGFTLAAVRATTEGLLSAGVEIHGINAARGRFDEFKLGGLRRAALPATVVTLASADILGDDAAIWPTLGGAPSYEPGAEFQGEVLARPADLRDAVMSRLRAQGLDVHAADDATGAVEALADRYGETIARMAPNSAWVAVGEPTVALPRARGRGGRAGRLALGVARALAGREHWSFLACASDGVDGSSGSAGAAVTGETWSYPGAERAWNTYADGEFLPVACASVVTGPTGVNLLDVHAMVRR